MSCTSLVDLITLSRRCTPSTSRTCRHHHKHTRIPILKFEQHPSLVRRHQKLQRMYAHTSQLGLIIQVAVLCLSTNTCGAKRTILFCTLVGDCMIRWTSFMQEICVFGTSTCPHVYHTHHYPEWCFSYSSSTPTSALHVYARSTPWDYAIIISERIHVKGPSVGMLLL